MLKIKDNVKLKKNGRYTEAKCCVLGNYYKYQKIDDEIDTCPLNLLVTCPQLAEKEKQLENAQNLKAIEAADELSLKLSKIHNQDKISFCIEQLEKVKELAIKDFDLDKSNLSLARVIDKMQQKINQLKGK